MSSVFLTILLDHWSARGSHEAETGTPTAETEPPAAAPVSENGIPPPAQSTTSGSIPPMFPSTIEGSLEALDAKSTQLAFEENISLPNGPAVGVQ